MLKAVYSKYLLDFKEPGGTSRGVLTRKETWFIKIYDDTEPERNGIGECAVFRGLSADDRPGFEEKLQEVCRNIGSIKPECDLSEWSSIRFGVEMAFADLKHGGGRILFPSLFTESNKAIEINGLIWMGDKTTMQQRIVEKLNAGFRCIKLKIGAIDFEAELSLLKAIRSQFKRDEIELRVDANGAFAPNEAIYKLEQLARFDLHSIEQPVRQGQWDEMARLCRVSPIPIALDEELIGIDAPAEKKRMLNYIRPSYIILKPALAGGFSGSKEWIEAAEEEHISWWITSALESNIGLNAIAQWAYTFQNPIPQGLGTGQIYTNNTPSFLNLKGSALSFSSNTPNQELNTFLQGLTWKA